MYTTNYLSKIWSKVHKSGQSSMAKLRQDSLYLYIFPHVFVVDQWCWSTLGQKHCKQKCNAVLLCAP